MNRITAQGQPGRAASPCGTERLGYSFAHAQRQPRRSPRHTRRPRRRSGRGRRISGSEVDDGGWRKLHRTATAGVAVGGGYQLEHTGASPRRARRRPPATRCRSPAQSRRPVPPVVDDQRLGVMSSSSQGRAGRSRTWISSGSSPRTETTKIDTAEQGRPVITRVWRRRSVANLIQRGDSTISAPMKPEICCRGGRRQHLRRTFQVRVSSRAVASG